MSLSRCCALRCRKPATVVQKVEPSHLDADPVRLDGRVRRYELCEEHNADYFGRSNFLSVEQLERIRRDLVPVSIG